MARRKALPPLSPLCRPGSIMKLDPRGAEAKLVRRLEIELGDQVGGQPTPGERMTIRNVAQAQMRLELVYRAFMQKGEATDNADKFMLGLMAAVDRGLGRLGLEKRQPAAMTLEGYIAMKVAGE